jgi:Fe-S-cluster containining protein
MSFLGTDKYCSIYQVIFKACRAYPHTNRRKIYQIDRLTVKNTVVCSVAFKMVELVNSRVRRLKGAFLPT